jgi:hypothetical protein
MKRIAILLSLLLAVTGAAFADHAYSKVGIGLVGGGGVQGGDIGLALKLPKSPLFWGLHLNIYSGYVGLGATGDKYFNDETLVREGNFKLDWYMGLGGYANLGFGSSASASIGARLPVGLSWHITKTAELWLGIAPSLGIGILPSFSFPNWDIAGELGFRLWLNQ